MDYNFSCNINVNGKGNTVNQYVDTTSTDDSPLRCTRVCGYWSIPNVYCWKGKTYEVGVFVNNYLQNIQKAWDSHCFSLLLESLYDFDHFMERVSEATPYTLPRGNSKKAKPISIFIGSVFQNFECEYGLKIGMFGTHPFFIDYLIDPDGLKDNSYLIGYDTSLIGEDIFENGIIDILDGDIHQLLIQLEDWYDSFHKSIINKNNTSYKAVRVSSIGSKSFILKELFDHVFGKTRKEAKAIQKSFKKKNITFMIA